MLELSHAPSPANCPQQPTAQFLAPGGFEQFRSAALQFQSGERAIATEDFARNLELQSQIDSYLVLLLFVAFFRKTQRVSRTDRRWLRFHLFEAQTPSAFQDPNLRGRYLETTELAAKYTYFLDTLNGLRRVEEIRTFRALDYGAKKQRILALMDAAPVLRLPPPR